MKTIEFTMRDSRGTSTISERFDEDTNWQAIAYSFWKFLQSQGYVLELEDVGACVDSYIGSEPKEENTW